MTRSGLLPLLLSAIVLAGLPASACADRIKDLAGVAGVRGNQLVGYGLVVGLDGSGDQTSQAPFTTQSLKNFLAQYGVSVPPDVNPQLKNVAAVAIHAMLPAFARPGQEIDITVSSIGNARSLRGGALLATALRGLDGQVYAIAQGNLVVSGFGVEGRDGSRVTLNVPSSGRIPNGATVERAVPVSAEAEPRVVFQLHTADFTTAARVCGTLEEALREYRRASEFDPSNRQTANRITVNQIAKINDTNHALIARIQIIAATNQNIVIICVIVDYAFS